MPAREVKPYNRRKPRRHARRVRAALRDTSLLLREFRLPLLAFSVLVGSGGVLYHWLARSAGEEGGESLAHAVYHVLSLVFLQSAVDRFPRVWFLQVFYFLMPLLGIGVLAQGLADFGVLFFNRRARGKEWQMAIAATLREHMILVGLGHLGYRVARYLHQLEQDLVVIEIAPHGDTAKAIQDLGIPIIADDARRESVLEAAGVRRARALVLCMQDDTLNLQIAVKARSLNPRIKVVVRIFDDDFAQALEQQFAFKALSATSIAAPAFAAAAVGIDVTRPITIEGQTFSLVRLEILPSSSLAGKTIGEVEREYGVSVVLVRRNGALHFHPAGDYRVQAHDTLAVMAEQSALGALVAACTS